MQASPHAPAHVLTPAIVEFDAVSKWYGNVIGVNTAIYGREGNIGIGFAMPINRAKPLLEFVRTGGKSRQALPLGVRSIFISGRIAQALELPAEAGYLIETVDPGWGVEKMVMTAAFTEPLVMKQTLAAFEAPARPDVEDLWDVLSNRHGSDCLYRALSMPTDIPERAVKRVPPTSDEVGSNRNAPYRRPQRLYRKPEEIMALAVLPDHPPRAFTWRGQRYAVA